MSKIVRCPWCAWAQAWPGIDDGSAECSLYNHTTSCKSKPSVNNEIDPRLGRSE